MNMEVLSDSSTAGICTTPSARSNPAGVPYSELYLSHCLTAFEVQLGQAVLEANEYRQELAELASSPDGHHLNVVDFQGNQWAFAVAPWAGEGAAGADMARIAVPQLLLYSLAPFAQQHGLKQGDTLTVFRSAGGWLVHVHVGMQHEPRGLAGLPSTSSLPGIDLDDALLAALGTLQTPRVQVSHQQQLLPLLDSGQDLPGACQAAAAGLSATLQPGSATAFVFSDEVLPDSILFPETPGSTRGRRFSGMQTLEELGLISPLGAPSHLGLEALFGHSMDDDTDGTAYGCPYDSAAISCMLQQHHQQALGDQGLGLEVVGHALMQACAGGSGQATPEYCASAAATHAGVMQLLDLQGDACPSAQQQAPLGTGSMSMQTTSLPLAEEGTPASNALATHHQPPSPDREHPADMVCGSPCKMEPLQWSGAASQQQHGLSSTAAGSGSQCMQASEFCAPGAVLPLAADAQAGQTAGERAAAPPQDLHAVGAAADLQFAVADAQLWPGRCLAMDAGQGAAAQARGWQVPAMPEQSASVLDAVPVPRAAAAPEMQSAGKPESQPAAGLDAALPMDDASWLLASSSQQCGVRPPGPQVEPALSGMQPALQVQAEQCRPPAELQLPEQQRQLPQQQVAQGGLAQEQAAAGPQPMCCSPPAQQARPPRRYNPPSRRRSPAAARVATPPAASQLESSEPWPMPQQHIKPATCPPGPEPAPEPAAPPAPAASQAPPAAAQPPQASPNSAPAHAVLVAKVLTRSDVTLGRIVLPRVAVETNMGFVCAYKRYRLPVQDRDGHRWPFSVKQWANGPESRKVYVLEGAAEYLRAYALDQGDAVGICVSQGTGLAGLFVEANTHAVREAVRQLTYAVVPPQQLPPQDPEDAAPQPLAEAATSGPMPAVQGGRCTRHASCDKPAGHTGFCSGKRRKLDAAAGGMRRCDGGSNGGGSTSNGAHDPATALTLLQLLKSLSTGLVAAAAAAGASDGGSSTGSTGGAGAMGVASTSPADATAAPSPLPDAAAASTSPLPAWAQALADGPLLGKILSDYDVLRGRVVLPRGIVEACMPPAASEQLCVLPVVSATGQMWPLQLRSQEAAGQHVHVLEGTGAWLSAAQAAPGHPLALIKEEGMLRAVVNTPEAAAAVKALSERLGISVGLTAAAAAAENGGGAAADAAPKAREPQRSCTPPVAAAADSGLPTGAATTASAAACDTATTAAPPPAARTLPVVAPRLPEPGSRLRCMRHPNCEKPAGHAGFCTNHKGFRKVRPIAEGPPPEEPPTAPGAWTATVVPSCAPSTVPAAPMAILDSCAAGALLSQLAALSDACPSDMAALLEQSALAQLHAQQPGAATDAAQVLQQLQVLAILPSEQAPRLGSAALVPSLPQQQLQQASRSNLSSSSVQQPAPPIVGAAAAKPVGSASATAPLAAAAASSTGCAVAGRQRSATLVPQPVVQADGLAVATPEVAIRCRGLFGSYCCADGTVIIGNEQLCGMRVMPTDFCRLAGYSESEASLDIIMLDAQRQAHPGATAATATAAGPGAGDAEPLSLRAWLGQQQAVWCAAPHQLSQANGAGAAVGGSLAKTPSPAQQEGQFGAPRAAQGHTAAASFPQGTNPSPEPAPSASGISAGAGLMAELSVLQQQPDEAEQALLALLAQQGPEAFGSTGQVPADAAELLQALIGSLSEPESTAPQVPLAALAAMAPAAATRISAAAAPQGVAPCSNTQAGLPCPLGADAAAQQGRAAPSVVTACQLLVPEPEQGQPLAQESIDAIAAAFAGALSAIADSTAGGVFGLPACQ